MVQVLENQVDAEAEAARVELQLGAQEWNMQEMERQQRLQVCFADNWRREGGWGGLYLCGGCNETPP